MPDPDINVIYYKSRIGRIEDVQQYCCTSAGKLKSSVVLAAVDVTLGVIYMGQCSLFPDTGVALHILGSHTPDSAHQLIKRSFMSFAICSSPALDMVVRKGLNM